MFDKLNERIKRLDVWDISLTKWSVLFVTIVIVKAFPQLLGIRYRYLIVLFLLCAVRPVYKFWIKK